MVAMLHPPRFGFADTDPRIGLLDAFQLLQRRFGPLHPFPPRSLLRCLLALVATLLVRLLLPLSGALAPASRRKLASRRNESIPACARILVPSCATSSIFTSPASDNTTNSCVNYARGSVGAVLVLLASLEMTRRDLLALAAAAAAAPLSATSEPVPPVKLGIDLFSLRAAEVDSV